MTSLPSDFLADVTRALEQGAVGELRLLSEEARRFSWGSEGVAAVDRALAELPAAGERHAHVVLFSGHRLDVAGRPVPRFPPTNAAQTAARELISVALAAQLSRADGRPLVGMAGGASGGDIVFHETCLDLGIDSRLFLGVDPERFARASVADAGPGWVERFDRLREHLPTRVLQDAPGRPIELPEWLRPLAADYSVWARHNLWMLHSAQALGSNVTVLVLWDGRPTGDGAGGTSHMVAEARRRGLPVVVLDAGRLPGVSSA